MDKAIIAIVGRPNVGKSTLFNRLAGGRIAIVDDKPGVTRDRIFADLEWRNRITKLIDTGGIEPFSNDEILSQMREQAQLAIDNADVIIMVTNVREGVTANDLEVANLLRKSGKPVVLCVNKVDTPGALPPEIYEFYNLGLGEPFAVSSVHGMGTGDLLDEVYNLLPDEKDAPDEERIKVAVIGKPNVGKSSLINKLSGEERAIVTNIPGTTRDAIDQVIDNNYGKYIFVDTAGIRKKAKVKEDVEYYSVLRSNLAVDRSDVVLIMIEATEGFTEQDSKIAGYAINQGKACFIVVNKWDAVEDKTTNTMSEMKKQLQSDFAFMSYAPIIFISVKDGYNVKAVYEMVNFVYKQNTTRISTGKLNAMLADATARVEPPSDKGRRLKIYYINQADIKPPTFVTFVNQKKLFHFSYQRYISNQIREIFDLHSTPIKFIVRERGE